MKNRLFIALEIPEEILDEIILIRDEIYGKNENVRWEKKEKLHITLKFLGDVELIKNDIIVSQLKEIVTALRPIHCEFEKFGLFYKNNKPGILWGGLGKNIFVEKLVNEIENRMENIGFPNEKRSFKAHFTLLRIKGREDSEKLNKFAKHEFDPLGFKADIITLYKSELLPAGSVYTKIETFKLI